MKWVVLFCCFYLTSALTVYNNARFAPTNAQSTLNNITNVSSQINCACICFNNLMCFSATYSGINQQCILYSVELDQGTLYVMTTNLLASVLSFQNKTSSPLRLTNLNQTFYAIWNTTVGHDSYSSMPGLSVGDYVSTQGPAQAFDQSTSTKYINFGVCNSSVGASVNVCGQNTGVYFSLPQGSSLLVAFRFWTADSYSARDPMNITIEGSNHPLASLVLGSSWTLIYQGSSGLDTDPGRWSYGHMQWLLNNNVSYSSYRLLVQSKRGAGNFVQYSEFELFGY